MIGTIFYVGTKTQQKIYRTDFVVGLKDVSNSLTYTFIKIFLEVKGWHDRNKRRLNYHTREHGLRTPNEGINQRSLKFWVDVADKICFGRT